MRRAVLLRGTNVLITEVFLSILDDIKAETKTLPIGLPKKSERTQSSSDPICKRGFSSKVNQYITVIVFKLEKEVATFSTN